MAERRMFAKTIIDSDAFLDMPLSTQALYFHLGMRADDEGFINNPKKIQRMIGASDDDLRVLFAKRFVLPFDTGIVVIKHWRIHNYIRADRLTETEYREERDQLIVKENGAYTMADKCQSNDGQVTVGRQEIVSIGKDSIGKDSLVDKRKRFAPPSVEEVAAYVSEKGYHFSAEQFVAFYESKGWKVGSSPMKDWKAACVTWETRWKSNRAAPKRNARPAEEHDYNFDDIEQMLLKKQKGWAE